MNREEGVQAQRNRKLKYSEDLLRIRAVSAETAKA